MPEYNGRSELQDMPMGELVKQLSEQTSRLVRAEVELAKAELAQKGKQAGIGAGMFGGAGIFGVYGFGALTAAIIAVLATAMATWLAALIVAVVYFAIAGVAALMGKNRVRQAGPPVPEEAIATTKADVDVTKARVKEARS
jgi:membrane protein